jgi:hypothetical protein
VGKPSQLANNFGSCYSSTQSPSEQDDIGGEQWLELVLPFRGTEDFCVANMHATNIIRALSEFSLADRDNVTVLPALRYLRIKDAVATNDPMLDALQSSQWLSSHLVELQLSCHICDSSPIQPHGFIKHFKDKHSHRTLCSYCGTFQPKHDRLFRKHLEDEHPEVVRKDPLISMPILTPSQLHRLIILCSPMSLVRHRTPHDYDAPGPLAILVRDLDAR